MKPIGLSIYFLCAIALKKSSDKSEKLECACEQKAICFIWYLKGETLLEL